MKLRWGGGGGGGGATVVCGAEEKQRTCTHPIDKLHEDDNNSVFLNLHIILLRKTYKSRYFSMPYLWLVL